MKTLLLFPPQWTPVSPHFALPSLLGQLKAKGYEAFGMDLNIDFYNKILNANFIKNAAMRAIDNNQNLLKEIAPYIQKSKNFNDYPLDIQNKIVKYSKIKEYVAKKQHLLLEIPDLAEESVRILKSREDFYKPETLIKAVNIIDAALEMASLPYFPSKMSLDAYSNPLFKLTFEHIKFFVFDKDTNIFIEYYKSILDEIISKNAQYIGISINSTGQIIPGLTLANILKNKTKAHINIGGNFFGRVKDAVVKNPGFFDLFCDSLLVEEGERPVVELADYISGKIEIDKVSNLIYKKDGEVVINETKKPMKLDEMGIVSLDGYDFSKYFAPEIILPFQSSRGCYWGKCSFCDQDFGQNFNVKNVEKLTDEFIELKEKYGIKYFEFIDESVSPAYLSELADKIKEKNIDINYFFDARLEKTFTKETLQKGFKSGLKMVLWGLESGSDSVMELINKGIDIDKRLEILKNSNDAGLWNFAFIFFGFPTETQEDARKTIKMLCENNDIIHSYGRSVFTMGKHTKLKDEPEKYGITAVYPAVDEFSPTYTFDCIGMTKDELNLILKECTEACAEAYSNPLWMYLRYREYIFLYLAKYGKDWVSGYKIDKNNL